MYGGPEGRGDHDATIDDLYATIDNVDVDATIDDLYATIDDVDATIDSARQKYSPHHVTRWLPDVGFC